ncbi:unnamed protein product [Lactuca saligna]|uniref:Uncharacterized protein n=1 Tax=Lactuca saligna TaxID=75948 RepID=A0AA35V7E4_LACSI|nr:unnamed protein product [Lactuca saligna]
MIESGWMRWQQCRHILVPQVLEMINNSHYLYRMTVVRAISLLASVMGSEITFSKLLPALITLSKDRVPNIKFNVAKVLQLLIPIVDHSVSRRIVKVEEKLAKGWGGENAYHMKAYRDPILNVCDLSIEASRNLGLVLDQLSKVGVRVDDENIVPRPSVSYDDVP